jgi:hypothetical protein
MASDPRSATWETDRREQLLLHENRNVRVDDVSELPNAPAPRANRVLWLRRADPRTGDRTHPGSAPGC